MRANYSSFIESLFNLRMRRIAHPQRERPLRRAVVLRLYRTQPTHNVSGILDL
jgi:hypothetical protein